MSIKQNKCSNAMYYSSSYSPTFGGGRDLHISSDANNNSKPCSYLGYTYGIPTGKIDTFLVGSEGFKVSEIELFQVV